eukprot:TRINITY_DN1616_c0_g3_i1.p1 TRINITY_DN1616_c0_g3~~TRINITY_DN1616_c0_g3_i1.p1  ORF type:complete len:605 (+),score=160.77 TRINITY_DN1616_c0_g3_i1:204-2018(+)
MTRKTTTRSLGGGIMADKKRQADAAKQKMGAPGFVGREDASASRSVLEQSSLDELLATVEVRKAAYAELMGEAEEVDSGPILVSTAPVSVAEQQAAKQRELMSIPRRPAWRDGMTVEELAREEGEAFTEWRRNLANHAADGGLHLTPYERNLDFWRQLWRCVERSDLIVQILDARDPDFYRCRDLAKYVEEVGAGSKRLMLLVNKADFLTAEQRNSWAEHFKATNVDVLFFSALRELQRQQVSAPSDAAVEARLAAGDDDDEEDDAGAVLGPSLDDAPDVCDCYQLLAQLRARLPEASEAAVDSAAADASSSGTAARPRRNTVGFVGYPNVGKSTVINALVGAKKVGMSRTPGKTKHIQTLELPEFGITLCDCPGLVFPSVVATRAHLVINNTVPLEDLRECFAPIYLIVEKMGFQKCLDSYACAAYVQDATKRSGNNLDETHSFLAALAVARNHFLRVGVPDENWAARKVLRDYCRGQLLYVEPPPGAAPASASAAPAPAGQADSGTSAAASGASAGYPGGAGPPVAAAAAPDAGEKEEEGEVSEGGDFEDLDAFIKEQAGQQGRRMTKRRARAMNKQIMRGKQPTAAPGHHGYSGGGKLMMM